MKLLSRPIFWIIGVPVVAILAYLAFGFFGVQYLFIDKTVSEDFPTTRPITAQVMSTATPMLATPTIPVASTEVAIIPTATPMPTITPAPTPSEPVLIRAGEFHDVVHASKGKALLYRNPDGSHLLRFEEFEVDNGPDLFVYMVAVNDSTNSATVSNSQFINVAPLKGNIGNQNYALPADFDPSMYNSVTIWCKQFSVNFATAPLDN